MDFSIDVSQLDTRGRVWNYSKKACHASIQDYSSSGKEVENALFNLVKQAFVPLKKAIDGLSLVSPG